MGAPANNDASTGLKQMSRNEPSQEYEFNGLGNPQPHPGTPQTLLPVLCKLWGRD